LQWVIEISDKPGKKEAEPAFKVWGFFIPKWAVIFSVVRI
jgi:hypothetical protein